MKIMKRRAKNRNSETLETLPKKKALLVGIQYENDEDDGKEGVNVLHVPHHDVNEMRELLIDCYEYAPGDIVVLIDRDDPGQIQPTRANILREIQKLVEDARPGDYFFFHYIGHTAQIWRDRENGADECLIPTDGVDDVIASNELQRHLVDSLPIGSNLVAVFDCPSGLNLEHFLCNRAYVPWISEGRRRSESSSQWNSHGPRHHNDVVIIQARFIEAARPSRLNTAMHGLVLTNKSTWGKCHLSGCM